MRIEALHIGQRVRHPQYGVGIVKTVSEHTADIQFDDGTRTVAPDVGNLEPAEPTVSIDGLQQPLHQLIDETVAQTLQRLGVENPSATVDQLAKRWHNGTLILRPADPALQSKEIELNVFFHKITLIRNNLRVLEQKINASTILSEADKVEWQQYITRCYGSLTTFNVLFAKPQEHGF